MTDIFLSYASQDRERVMQLKREVRKMADTAPTLTLFVDVLMALLDGITVNALVDPEYWTPARQLRSLRWAIHGLVS